MQYNQSVRDKPVHIHLKRVSVIIFCLIFFILQYWMIPQYIIQPDEFFFAHHIYQYTHALPYRDFPPYKTVLGYYILTPAFLFVKSHLQAIFYLKSEMVILNSILFFSVLLLLKKIFKLSIIIFVCTLIFSNQLFLMYSSEIRVDMLATWCGTLSILFLYIKKPKLSGLLLGISFLISQKAIWFWFATNFTLSMIGFTQKSIKPSIHKILKINGMFGICIIFYSMFWSYWSNAHIVIQNILLEAFHQARLTWYAHYHHLYWQVILSDGPLLMLLWPFTVLPIFIQNNKKYVLPTLYTNTVLFLILTYQQAFPYNTIFLFPAFLLAYTHFIHWLNQTRHTPELFSTKYFFAFCSLHSISMILILSYFKINSVYFYSALIPIFLYLFLRNPKGYVKNLAASFLFILIFILGLYFPAHKQFTLPRSNIQNAQFQQHILVLGEKLFEPGDSYIAGTPMYYDKNQAVLGLKNLIEPALSYLYYPDKNLVPALLPSLYMAPRTRQQVLNDLSIAPIKFYINNIRMDALPPEIKTYLHRNFLHFWGSVYLYAPMITSQKYFLIKFNGKYRLITKKSVEIDHHTFQPNAIIYLSSGNHIFRFSNKLRLAFVPDLKNIRLDLSDKKDKLFNMLSLIV